MLCISFLGPSWWPIGLLTDTGDWHYKFVKYICLQHMALFAGRRRRARWPIKSHWTEELYWWVSISDNTPLGALILFIVITLLSNHNTSMVKFVLCVYMYFTKIQLPSKCSFIHPTMQHVQYHCHWSVTVTVLIHSFTKLLHAPSVDSIKNYYKRVMMIDHISGRYRDD